MRNATPGVYSDTTADKARPEINIQEQSANAIQTELTLRMESVISSINSLERAQQVTQEALQLEVCV